MTNMALLHKLNSRLTYSDEKFKIPLFSYSWPKSVEVTGYPKTRLLLGEQITPEFKKACVAEFIAMLFFVVMCCGCAMVNLALPNPNLMTVASSFGFGILVLAQFVGPLSGGHINCAVSWALFVAGRTSLIKCICYTVFQMWGSIFGALFLWSIFGNNWPAARAFGSNSWDESIFSGGQVFLSEMAGTMILIYSVFATIDCPTKGGGPLGVYPIAMSVMVAHLFLLPIDGCSINPTRSFGPSLVAAFAGISGTYYHQQYMFWFAPLMGATITAIVYEYAPLKPKKRENKEDMATTIFQSDEVREEVEDDDADEDDGKDEGLEESVLHNVGSSSPDDDELVNDI